MSRFSDRLKLSVSAIALMGGSLTAMTARAVTITGTQTMVDIATLTGDLTIAGTGVISPGGFSIDNLNGDLVNNGLVETLVAPAAATGTLTVTVNVYASGLAVNNDLNGDFTNNGTIAASSTGTGIVSGVGSGTFANNPRAGAYGYNQNGTLTGNFENNADISASASLSLDVTHGTQAAPVTSILADDTPQAYAGAVYIEELIGGFSNTSSDSIDASVDMSSDYTFVASGAAVDVGVVDQDARATATGVYIYEGTADFDNSGSISASINNSVGVDIDAEATAGTAIARARLNDMDNYANGVGIDSGISLTDFNNSGLIAATIIGSNDILINVDGTAGASAIATYSASGYASALYINNPNGDVANSGTISADVNTTVMADITAASENGAARILVDDFANGYAYAGARGTYLGDFNASFTNTSSESVDANATSAADVILSASGASAYAKIEGANVSDTATGVYFSGGEFTVDNSGAISANASGSATYDVSLTASEGAAQADLTPDHWASAYGINVSGSTTVTDFVNSGSITANAATAATETVVASAGPEAGNASITLSNDVSASAYGVYLFAVEGVFDNSGTISAASSGMLDVTATADSVDGQSFIDVDDDFEVYAYGVEIKNLTGDFINSSDLTIAATASAVANYDLNAIGTYASISMDDISIEVSAYGLEVGSGTYTIDNSGTITATATGSVTVNATSTAVPVSAEESGETAYVTLSTLSAYVAAYGIDANGSDSVTGFTNSGTVSANAAFTAIETLTANGQTDASISISNSITVYAYGVYIQNMADDFDNSGSISATASADLVVTAVADDAFEDAYVTVYEDNVEVYAFGVYLDDFTGTLTNSSPDTIAATATANIAYDLSAAGPYASVSADSQSVTMEAIGVYVDEGTFAVNNTGAVSADASLDMTVNASADATDTYGEVDIDDLYIDVYAGGIEGDGTSTSFNNSGSITATAAVTLTENISANGETSASADVDNYVTLSAIGVLLTETLAGDFVNSGSITSSGSLSYVANISSTQSAGPDFADINNEFYVAALGVAVDFTTPETGPLHSFTNEGDIAATGVLSMMQTVTAGAQDVPTSTMADPSDTPTITTTAELYVLGAWLTGGVGTVNNSGTITASGSIQAPDGYAAVSAVILPDAADGLVVNNDGEIIASLTGVAAESTVVALYLGPTETTEQASASSATTDYDETGLITVNNSGTISATNTTGSGPAIGIDIQNAPVPVEINQMGGEISGITAIAMDQGHDDVLNWTGGTIHGLVDADSGDVVNVFGGGVVVAPTDFALEGAGTVNVNLPGATSMEATTFQVYGSITNTGTLNINPYGNLYVGIPAVIELGGDTFNMAEDTSTLTIELQPGAAGSLSTTGDANIDGTLTAAPLPGLYLDTETFRIITAGVGGTETGTGTGEQTGTDVGLVNGTFDAVTGDTLLLEFSATINPSSVDLTYNRVPFDEAVPLSGNALSVAEGLEAGYDPTLTPSGNDPDLYDVLANMFVLTDAGAYADTLFSWAGAEHAQVIGAAVNLAEPYHMAISEHLNDTRLAGGGEASTVAIRSGVGTMLSDPAAGVGSSGNGKKASFWGRAFGRWSDVNGDSNAPGYDEETYGVVIGFDYAVAENVKIGIVGAYTNDDIEFDDNVDEADIERFTIGGYVSADIDKFYIDAAFSYFSDDYKVSRTVQYGDSSCPTFTCTTWASSDYGGDGLLVHGEVGYKLNPGNGDMVLQPFVGLDYSDVNIDSFAESGAGDLNLLVNDGGGESLQSRLGARLSANWNTGGSTIVRPELRVEWRHEFEDDPRHFSAVLAGDTGIGFTTVGSKVTDDLVVIGAGATATFEGGINAFFEYQGAFGSGYNSHIIQLGARVPF